MESSKNILAGLGSPFALARYHYKQLWAGLHECVGELTCTASYEFKIIRKAINNRKTKLMVKKKTAQYTHDIELHSTEKEKRTQTRKLKRFLSNSKGCRDV